MHTENISVLSAQDIDAVAGAEGEIRKMAYDAGVATAEFLEDAAAAVSGFFSGLAGAFSNDR